jgi:hypothetical protein
MLTNPHDPEVTTKDETPPTSFRQAPGLIPFIHRHSGRLLAGIQFLRNSGPRSEARRGDG